MMQLSFTLPVPHAADGMRRPMVVHARPVGGNLTFAFVVLGADAHLRNIRASGTTVVPGTMLHA